jgi:hypothetical protein
VECLGFDLLAFELATGVVEVEHHQRLVKHTSSHQSLLWDNRHNGLGEWRREAERFVVGL